jgi:predicted RNA-binding Zn-ribbon protein involved in translation (DUF1610 family)
MDTISIECPNCGESVEVSKNTVTFICPKCQQQHLVSYATGTSLVEAHARCPLCQLNDRSRKVSSFMVSGGANSRYFAPPPKPNPPNSKPQPPQPPEAGGLSGNSGCLIWGGAFLFLVMLIGLLNNSNNNSSVFFIILLLAGAGIFAIGLSQKNKNKAIIIQSQQKYQDDLNRWNLSTNKNNLENEELQRKWDSRWRQAMEAWNKLYYCERDDIVFMPGRNTYAPLSDIVKYVYAESNPTAES